MDAFGEAVGELDEVAHVAAIQAKRRRIVLDPARVVREPQRLRHVEPELEDVLRVARPQAELHAGEVPVPAKRHVARAPHRHVERRPHAVRPLLAQQRQPVHAHDLAVLLEPEVPGREPHLVLPGRARVVVEVVQFERDRRPHFPAEVVAPVAVPAQPPARASSSRGRARRCTSPAGNRRSRSGGGRRSTGRPGRPAASPMPGRCGTGVRPRPRGPRRPRPASTSPRR